MGAELWDGGRLTTEGAEREVVHFKDYILGPRLGAGGMGMVFAGHQVSTGRKVAIKLMRDAGTGQATKVRFLREAVTLAGLRHPAIVEYIDHGVTDDGHAYLVMEWLSGEDLHARLARGPLSLGECRELAVRLTDALAVAHHHGVVHRDIKPSNIFLAGGAIEQAKLLDFGVARVDFTPSSLTRTGALIGTIGYMAPEQARGEPDLDGRADLYSLGCVLHECITGAPLFTGEHPMAVLAKILLDEVPRIRSIRPDVPGELDVLVADLLARDRQVRPSSAKILAVRLAALPAEMSGGQPIGPVREGVGVTLREQQVFSLLLLRLQRGAVDPLATTGVVDPEHAELVRTAAAFGASFTPLLGGFGLISVLLEAPASDVSMQAARCALAIRRLRPGVAQVLVTGRAQRQGTSFVGRVIEDAMVLERHARDGAIFVDEATTELLRAMFVIERVDERFVLVSEREALAVRTLLGRPAPFVGRAREMAWLVGLVREAVDESRSCVALVTAEPGAGKTRLRVELVRTLRTDGIEPLVLVGRAAPMTRGAALGVLRSAIRRELGLADGETAEQQRARLCQRVAASVVIRERARVAAFLGEICGLHLPDTHHPSLPLARRDASVMADSTRIAWVDWLRAECLRRPVLLILEDLHWGDAASVAYVETALKELSDLPLVVLAVARPEVHSLFPWLWSGCRLTTLELPPLSARAGEMLARQVLGAEPSQALISTLVAHAEGNPFFLEELLRAAATGATDQLPDTVLGIVQARLQAVDHESRRLLRAASVFGGGFTEAALARITGQPVEAGRARLAVLVHQEYLSRELQSDSVTYRFRHALLRDASYAMLLDDDRRLAHRLAAEWLAEQQDYEPFAVAKHYADAGIQAEARGWFKRAAEQALEGGDFAAAVERAEQSITCGATGELRADLRLLQVEARLWAGSLVDVEQWALEAVAGLRPGSMRWFNAIQKTIYCASVRGDIEALLARLARAEQAVAEPDARYGPLLCLCEAMNAVYYIGTKQQMATLCQRLDFQVVELRVPPLFMGHVQRARSTAFGMFGRSDRSAVAAAEAAEHFTAAGDIRNAGRVRVIEGLCLMHLGDFSGAERALRTVESTAVRLGVEQTLFFCRTILGEVLMRTDRLDDARAVLLQVLDAVSQRREPRLEGVVCIDLGLTSLALEDLAEAEAYVRRGLVLVAGQTTLEIWGLASLARIRLLTGDREQAGALASRALALAESGHAIHHGGYVWLALVECFADADAAAYALAIEKGLAWVRSQLEGITDAEFRRSFLAMPVCRALAALGQIHGEEVDDLDCPATLSGD